MYIEDETDCELIDDIEVRVHSVPQLVTGMQFFIEYQVVMNR